MVYDIRLAYPEVEQYIVSGHNFGTHYLRTWEWCVLGPFVVFLRVAAQEDTMQQQWCGVL